MKDEIRIMKAQCYLRRVAPALMLFILAHAASRQMEPAVQNAFESLIDAVKEDWTNKNCEGELIPLLSK